MLIKDIILVGGLMNSGISVDTFITIGVFVVILVSGAVWFYEKYAEGMFDA